jgi:integrase
VSHGWASVRTSCPLGRYSSAIRAACANERSCGSARGAISNGRPYRDRTLTPLRDAIKSPTHRFGQVADRYSTGSSCLDLAIRTVGSGALLGGKDALKCSIKAARSLGSTKAPHLITLSTSFVQLWHFVQDEVPRLPERRDIGRALQPEEKLRLLKVAQSRPEWETAYLASVLALNTTMRGCEVKQLRWRDIDLMDHSLVIRRSKTIAGERVIPLNVNAYTAVMRLRERAQMLLGGDLKADWYVFPSAEGYSKPDPTKPMSGWRSAWRNLTRAINCPACGELQDPGTVCSKPECSADVSKAKSSTAGLRFHDLRHHAITELAESQASDRTVMAIAGHVSQRMLAHYSHVRIEATRKALDALAVGVKKVGYDTNRDTKPAETAILSLQVNERNGGDDGTRTRDLCRDRAAF